MSRLSISTTTIKRLFAVSRNICAFPECTKLMVDDKGRIFGEICHIEAANEGGERYNKNSDDEYRRSFDNLLLLCHDHHIITDDVLEYDASKMQKIKNEHESRSTSNFAISDELVDKVIEKQINVIVRNEIIHTTNLPEKAMNVIIDTLEEKKIEVKEWQHKAAELEKKYNELITNLSKDKEKETDNKDIKKLIESGDFEGVKSILNSRINSNKINSRKALIELASIEELQLNTQAAIDYLLDASNLGEDNLPIYTRLGMLYRDTSNFTESISHFQTAINYAEKENDQFALSNLTISIAGLYTKIENWQESDKWLDKAFNIMKANDTVDNFTLANAYNSTGLSLMASDHKNESIEYFEQAYMLLKDHSDDRLIKVELPAIFSNLCISLQEKDIDKSIYYGVKGITFVLQNLPKNYDSLIALNLNLSRSYILKKNMQQAHYHVLQAQNLALSFYSSESMEISSVYNILGQIYVEQGKVAEAIILLHKAINIKEAILGKNHSTIGMLYGNLANIYSANRDIDMSISMHKKAMDIDIQSLGPNSLSVAIDKINLAVCYLFKSDINSAKEQVDDFLMIMKDKDSLFEIYMVESIIEFAHSLLKCEEYRDANKYAKIALSKSKFIVNNKNAINKARTLIKITDKIIR